MLRDIRLNILTTRSLTDTGRRIQKRRHIQLRNQIKKTKYYFKVRAYVINGNKKLYGSYSKVKSITVKK